MRLKTLFVPLVVLMLVGTACGSDDDSTDDAATTTAAAAADPPVYTIGVAEEADGKHFKFDVPAEMKAGVVTFQLKNEGKELHDFQLAKAVDGHTLEEIIKEVNDDEAAFSEWIVATGGVGSTPPGQTREVTLDLEPGTYWYFCTEQSGDEESPVKHAINGMQGEFSVSEESGAVMPETDASIEAKDYSFAPVGLKAGPNTLTFTNAGQQPHHALVVPIADGKTFEDAKTALASEEEPAGPPPVDFEKGQFSSVITAGQSLVTNLDLEAGKSYALLCFMPDKGTAGPPHLTKGMIMELKVT